MKILNEKNEKEVQNVLNFLYKALFLSHGFYFTFYIQFLYCCTLVLRILELCRQTSCEKFQQSYLG